jgi:hypothetical protein
MKKTNELDDIFHNDNLNMEFDQTRTNSDKFHSLKNDKICLDFLGMITK